VVRESAAAAHHFVGVILGSDGTRLGGNNVIERLLAERDLRTAPNADPEAYPYR